MLMQILFVTGGNLCCASRKDQTLWGSKEHMKFLFTQRNEPFQEAEHNNCFNFSQTS